VCKKLLVEIYRAKQQGISIVSINDDLFQVSLQELEEKKPSRIVNLDLQTCSCKRIFAFGFPCWHIIAVMNYQGFSLIDSLPALVNSRWNCIHPENRESFHQNTNIQSINFPVVEKKSLKRLPIQEIKPEGKSSLKKNWKESLPSSSTASKIKMPNFSGIIPKDDSFSFLNWEKNSCRFDVFLAESTVIENESNILQLMKISQEQINENLEILSNCIFKLNLGIFSQTQKKFIQFCEEKNIITEDSNKMGCLLELLENYFEGIVVQEFCLSLTFFFKCATKYFCPNKEEGFKKVDISPFLKLEIQKNDKDVLASLNSWLMNQQEITCSYCYEEKGLEKFSKITKILIQAPVYLKISLESLLTKTARIRKGLSEFKINSMMEIFGKTYELKCIIYFINGNHYTIEVKNPQLYKKKRKMSLEGYYCYDDLKGDFKKIADFSIFAQDFILERKLVPLLLTYKSI